MRNKERAKEYGKRFIKLTIITGIAGSIVILCVRPVVLSVLTLSDDARKLLSVMLLIMAYYVIAQAYNTTLIVGVFRGVVIPGLVFSLMLHLCGGFP